MWKTYTRDISEIGLSIHVKRDETTQVSHNCQVAERFNANYE